MTSETGSKHTVNQAIRDKTIAVLPFVNMSGNRDFEYFSDGITEEIINALAKVDSLKITSRTSSFVFKNANKPVEQIAKELKVEVVLEGSVRLAKDTVRITAQLIQAEHDFHFWSETWDRKLENIFEVQDEISLLIADKLREQYGHFEIQEHLVPRKTANISAYDYSLKARFHFNKWNPEDVRKSIDLNEMAISIDPKFTEAYVGLADAYSFLAVTEMMPSEAAWSKVKEYIQKAKTLDANNAGVYYQLANLYFFTEADFKSALEYALKALELNPNYVQVLQFTSLLYILSGNLKKGRSHIDLGLKINPLSHETLFYKAYYYYRMEEFGKALDIFNKMLEANPKNIPGIVQKCYCLIHQGQPDKALDYLDSISKDLLPSDEYLGIACLANMFISNNNESAETLFLKLQEAAQNKTSFQAHSYLYLAYAIANKPDEAFDWLEKMININSPIILISFADPFVNILKKDARYLSCQQKLFPVTKYEDLEKATKTPLLDESTTVKYSEFLLKFIEEEEPFLVPNLSLRSLAEQVQIHPNKLSWLLNEQLGQNFNEFINHYRIEYFKTLAQNPDYSHISLLGLAYESGFNSKTVFNTYFKKETGMTPKEFLKKRQL
ncbi:tetratricopeptide repeat protein [Saccharicrinis sp. GN24d3]|uniref:tetratricopeptide repeat protein n=1 Tax=Saccharicrinis sp. GN24d3 TaxID=3458416 RepID=UPI004036CE0D